MQEVWKIISNTNDRFLISNHGNVRSNNDGSQTCKTQLYKNHKLNKNHKLVVILGKSHNVHQLVAETFIDNNDPSKNVVKHKDGDTLNNHVDNLEWTPFVDNKKCAVDNLKCVVDNKKCAVKNKKNAIWKNNNVTKRAVRQYDKNNNFIREFESLKQAKEITGIDDGGIAKVCKGNRPFAGGFYWEFAEENLNEYHDIDFDTSEYIDFKGFPNYKIAKDGNIYSVRFKKLLKQQINSDGYKIISIVNNNYKKTCLVHRLVAEHFIAKIAGKDQVNHKDLNKLNCHVDNLEWVTGQENIDHYWQMMKKMGNK
jgi:hypothetical protein